MLKGNDGKDGVDGKDGQDGYTPQRGIDYWNYEDVTYMKNYIDGLVEQTVSGSIVLHREITSGTNADGKATNSNYGHVELSDIYSGGSGYTPAAAASGGTAATPKAVADALHDAKDYDDQLVGDIETLLASI